VLLTRPGSYRFLGVVHLGDSRPSTCPRARRRSSGLPRSPSPAVVRKRSASSCPTRPSDRRRPATLEKDLPWARSDHAGLRIDLNWGRGAVTRCDAGRGLGFTRGKTASRGLLGLSRAPWVRHTVVRRPPDPMSRGGPMISGNCAGRHVCRVPRNWDGGEASTSTGCREQPLETGAGRWTGPLEVVVLRVSDIDRSVPSTDGDPWR
jgi:hypothetical protein